MTMGSGPHDCDCWVQEASLYSFRSFSDTRKLGLALEQGPFAPSHGKHCPAVASQFLQLEKQSGGAQNVMPMSGCAETRANINSSARRARMAKKVAHQETANPSKF